MRYQIVCGLSLTLIWSSLAGRSTALDSVISVPDPLHSDINYQDEINAISFLDNRTRRQDAIFNEAVQLLDSMKSSPSCNRIAATRLVTSCQAVGGKDTADPNTQESLDRIRSVYAARLAICELDGAGASAPAPCLPLTVSSPTTKPWFGISFKNKTPGISSDYIPKPIMEQCLRALESRPQWWTSYSNNRQNAMVICQAARIETEKEELLNLHQSIVQSSVKLDDGLREALNNAAAQSARNEAFVQAVRALQDKLVKDMEGIGPLFQRKVDGLLHEIEVSVNKATKSVATALGHVKGEAGILGKDIQNASDEANALQRFLKEVHNEAVRREQETLRAQEQSALVHRDLADALHFSLESLVDTDLTRVFQNVVRFDASLEWLTNRLALILEQEDTMSQRLQNIEEFMKNSEQKATDLQKAQHLQAEAMAAQAQAQEAMQYNAKLSQALLDKTATTAANLHTIIDEATVKAKQVPGLHRGGFSTWTLCLVLLIVIGARNIQVAIGLLFLLIGHSIAASFYQYL